MAVVIGLSMAAIFERGVKVKKDENRAAPAVSMQDDAEVERPRYIAALFFVLLMAILPVGTSGLIS
jgi:hypothetical protein